MDSRQRALTRGLVVVCAVLGMFRGMAFSTERQVPSVSYPTIQSAINASSPGDTVRVFSGTYTGPITVSMSLVLIGSGDTATTTINAPADFDSNAAYNHVLNHFTTERAIVYIGKSTSMNVTMSGFTIDGLRLGPDVTQKVAYSGILAERCNVTLTDNIVRNMLPADSATSTWDPNRLYNGRGIEVRGDSAVATLSNNFLEQVNHFYILINATDDNAFPAVRSPLATVSGNTILGKGVYNGGQKGIWFNAGAWGTASGNTITEFDFSSSRIEPERASCIVVRYGYLDTTHSVTITGNRLIAPSHINNKGVYIQGYHDVVTGNYISGFRWNIESHDGVSVLIAQDSIIGGHIGVHVTSEKTPPYFDTVTIGGSPENKNVIQGQDARALGGFAVDLTFRNSLDSGDYRSAIPVNATYNDFGIYTYGALRSRFFERGDTTLTPYNIDTIYYSPFYCPTLRTTTKVFLQGPYDAAADTMHGSLNSKGYLAAHFVGHAIPTSAVDSISIEMRNAQSAGASTYQQFAPAWLLTKGGILDFSDTTKSYVEFASTWSGPYYTVIHHRNHLAIMDSTAQLIDDTTSPALYDFSTAQNKAFGTNPMAAVGTRFAMFAGDVNGDGHVKYNLAGNDRALILVRIGGSNIDATLNGYYNEDVNMDGVVKYNLAGNDRGIILVNIGGTNINAILSTQVP